jgi:hypothetical protein
MSRKRAAECGLGVLALAVEAAAARSASDDSSSDTDDCEAPPSDDVVVLRAFIARLLQPGDGTAPSRKYEGAYGHVVFYCRLLMQALCSLSRVASDELNSAARRATLVRATFGLLRLVDRYGDENLWNRVSSKTHDDYLGVDIGDGTWIRRRFTDKSLVFTRAGQFMFQDELDLLSAVAPCLNATLTGLRAHLPARPACSRTAHLRDLRAFKALPSGAMNLLALESLSTPDAELDGDKSGWWTCVYKMSPAEARAYIAPVNLARVRDERKRARAAQKSEKTKDAEEAEEAEEAKEAEEAVDFDDLVSKARAQALAFCAQAASSTLCAQAAPLSLCAREDDDIELQRLKYRELNRRLHDYVTSLLLRAAGPIDVDNVVRDMLWTFPFDVSRVTL